MDLYKIPDKADPLKKLTIVYSDLGIGGIQRKIIDIVNHIGQFKGYDKYKIILLLENKKKFELSELITNKNVRIIYKRFERVPLWLFILFHLVRLKPDIMLTFLPRSSISALKALALFPWRKPRSVVSEDVITSDAFLRGDFDRKFYKEVTAKYNSVDLVIVPSVSIKDDLTGIFSVDQNRISVIPNWTILPKIYSNSKKSKKYDLIYAGRLDPEKNIPYLLKCLRKITKINSATKAVILGGGSEEKEILKYIYANKLQHYIDLVPPTANVGNYFRMSKVGIFASVSEGLPMFILEANSFGIPVVATDGFKGVRKVILDGKTGYVCSNQAVFCNRILQLLKNKTLLGKMGIEARNEIKKSYSQKNLINFTSKLLQ